MPFALFKDARYFQILFQSIFLGYGILFLHWGASWWLYGTYFTAGLCMQLLCELIFSKLKPGSKQSWKKYANGIPSVLISSFSLALLLKTNSWTIAVLAAGVAILSKYLLRFNGKHIFNPSALGIATVIFFTHDAWISPGQWGSGIVQLFAVMSLGFIIVTRVQKLDVSLAFLGTFGLLLYLRQVIYLGWPMDFFVQSISNGSLLLFSFFMITDPKTIPNHRMARIGWTIAVAAVAFYCSTFKYINGAPIWVLVLAQPLVPLLDKIFRSGSFQWNSSRKMTTQETGFLQKIYTHSVM